MENMEDQDIVELVKMSSRDLSSSGEEEEEKEPDMEEIEQDQDQITNQRLETPPPGQVQEPTNAFDNKKSKK